MSLVTAVKLLTEKDTSAFCKTPGCRLNAVSTGDNGKKNKNNNNIHKTEGLRGSDSYHNSINYIYIIHYTLLIHKDLSSCFSLSSVSSANCIIIFFWWEFYCQHQLWEVVLQTHTCLKASFFHVLWWYKIQATTICGQGSCKRKIIQIAQSH